MSGEPLAEIGRVIDQGAEADDVLRTVVSVLARAQGVMWAGVFFLEDGELELGPSAGTPDESRRTSVPVVYQDTTVGAIAVDGTADAAQMGDVAELIATHVLLGWDTGGDAWEP